MVSLPAGCEPVRGVGAWFHNGSTPSARRERHDLFAVPEILPSGYRGVYLEAPGGDVWPVVALTVTVEPCVIWETGWPSSVFFVSCAIPLPVTFIEPTGAPLTRTSREVPWSEARRCSSI